MTSLIEAGMIASDRDKPDQVDFQLPVKRLIGERINVVSGQSQKWVARAARPCVEGERYLPWKHLKEASGLEC